jgi:hypothetical protein
MRNDIPRAAPAILMSPTLPWRFGTVTEVVLGLGAVRLVSQFGMLAPP